MKSNENLIASVQTLGGAYKGFWAWELALVVRFFDIDDSSFADHEFYPVDLAHYRVKAGGYSQCRLFGAFICIKH